ncbi:hypothetical protein [Bifidobacterium aerophilum]|uniref:Uncharacterized protein n=1 Tax=Bifidobacterium aerophilum TaxID=1798155 RepID=A0A6N9Z914_9BIFI|nr:hypothetical protein [Bifidobacterium aerophilum]NEG90583.1 hypothetical protein [Bifidobacterium aerophilum]
MKSTTEAMDRLDSPDRKAAPTDTTPTGDMSVETRLFIQQAQRIAVIDSQIKELMEERDDLKSQILMSHPDPGSYEAGALTVTVKTGAKRLDPRKLEQAYPADKYPQLYKATLDTKAVRSQFAPAALEAYQTTGNPTVVVA